MIRTGNLRTIVAVSFVFLVQLAPRPPARAESTRVLSLDQVLTMARKNNRTLVAERERVAQAQTNLEQAWSVLFPSVVAQGKYTRNNTAFVFSGFGEPSTQSGPALTIQPLNQLDGVVSFTAPLLVPPAYPGLESVKSSVRASEADYDVSLANVLFAVAQTYYAAGIADEVETARQSSIEVARATLDNARTRFSAGAVTKVDLDRAELAVVHAEQALREAHFAREQSYRALATLIQSDGGFRVESIAPESAAEPARDLDLALRLRPEFRTLELSARAEAALARAQAWRWAPTVSGFGSARIFNYDNFARERHAWAVGVSLDWVLFDGGVRDAQRHLAASQAREALARSQVLRDSIRDDLANGHDLLDTKRRAQEAAERSVALAMETLELVRTQYEAGNIAQIDLLAAQDGLVAAKEALAQSHFEVALADLSLRRAAGTFPGK